jgi:hypothetical protein
VRYVVGGRALAAKYQDSGARVCRHRVRQEIALGVGGEHGAGAALEGACSLQGINQIGVPVLPEAHVRVYLQHVALAAVQPCGQAPRKQRTARL